MKKVFICADIEGTCGIASWDETERFKPGYAPFARQMSREVAAACEGALEAGVDEVLVRDAHDSALNIAWEHLPRQAKLIRGWAQDPYCMMSGLDATFYGAVLTGCHDAAGTGSNPLSHTMDTQIAWMELGGERLSEARINAYTAASVGVPLLAVSGDEGICAGMKSMVSGLFTVGVCVGKGNSSLSIHPDVAVERIRSAVRDACRAPRDGLLLSLPEHFRLDVRYVRHPDAYKAGFYPGVTRLDSHTIRFETASWHEALRMMLFCL